MRFNPNTKQHKATHNNYKGKPTKGQVSSLLLLYGACQVEKKAPTQLVKVDKNGQTKLNF